MPSPPGTPSQVGPEPPERVVLCDLPPRKPWWRRLLRWALFVLVALVNAVAVALVAAWAYFARGLPSVPTVDEYRPPVVTELVSADGQVAGEFFSERRKVVPLSSIPRHLVEAFVAAEDKNFFAHAGVDWLGTVRAAVNTYVLRHKIQGGSTITQQTAKALLVSQEGFAQGTRKDLRRKVREAILAGRLERALSKNELLWLYLNGVYLGHHSYGVQAASENYFRKNVEDLTLAEAALLAGLPQAPSRYSPFVNPEAARLRRRYVLRRMREDGMITEAERRAADEVEIRVYGVDDVFRETAPFYAEAVRRLTVERYGNERLLEEGLRIEMAMDLDRQRAAQAAMLEGLLEVDRRQGFWGPVAHVDGQEREEFRRKLAEAWPVGSIGVGEHAVGVVSAVNDLTGQVRVDLGEEDAVLPVAGMRWARPPNPQVHYEHAMVSRPSSALHVGDVVVVRRVTRDELVRSEKLRAGGKPETVPSANLLVALEQEPRLQGALVALDPWSGYVEAMVGGYDFDASEFNRAQQACRQPGSAFKPVVYSAAIEKLGFTPSTLLTDAPVVFRDDQSAWKPQNFGEDFKGDVTLRTALVNSMNIPAVKTAEALSSRMGPKFLGDWARELGLTTPVKPELGSALGSSCTTLWDLVNVYAVIDRYGERRPARLLKRVLDRDGHILEDHASPWDPWVPLSARMAAGYAEARTEHAKVLDERAAYVLVHLLGEVATVGTGAQASRLGKPVAGKTGTTNDSFDTWFMGFTRGEVAGVWLGFDKNEQPLGRAETGGRAALPIWLAYMQAALRDRPQPLFPIPEGIVFERIDPKTGKALAPFAGEGVLEPYLAGTQPQLEEAQGQPQVEVKELFAQ